MRHAISEIDAATIADPESFARQIVEPCRPVVLRGIVAQWPAVHAGIQSPSAFRDYVAPFDSALPVQAFVGDPAIRGRFHYGEDLAGFNFERRSMTLTAALDAIIAGLEAPGSPSIYAGSVTIDDALPGFAAQNPLALLPAVRPRIWLGHASNVSAHYDTMDNIACVVGGRRRFTLYPPTLIGNLYVGPIDHTMAGQPVSLAASSDAPSGTYPLFDAIRDQALVAELAPGDGIYVPKLWWHQVEGLAHFNVLVNYWWDGTKTGPDAPYTTLLLAMIAIAERPAPERAAWQALFEHYVFRPNGHPLAHLPAERHGILGPLRQGNYGRIRAWVMNALRGGQ